jgi:hypothetical protein
VSDHRILDVAFVPGHRGRHAPIACTCGWLGEVNDWLPHRREHGLKAGQSGTDHTIGPRESDTIYPHRVVFV